MPDYVTVAQTTETAPGEMKLVDVAGDDVIVVNLDGTFVAFGNDCTHTGGPPGGGRNSREKRRLTMASEHIQR